MADRHDFTTTYPAKLCETCGLPAFALLHRPANVTPIRPRDYAAELMATIGTVVEILDSAHAAGLVIAPTGSAAVRQLMITGAILAGSTVEAGGVTTVPDSLLASMGLSAPAMPSPAELSPFTK